MIKASATMFGCLKNYFLIFIYGGRNLLLKNDSKDDLENHICFKLCFGLQKSTYSASSTWQFLQLCCSCRCSNIYSLCESFTSQIGKVPVPEWMREMNALGIHFDVKGENLMQIRHCGRRVWACYLHSSPYFQNMHRIKKGNVPSQLMETKMKK